eukprot:702269-Hanusia_phi.AAC.3
MGGGVVPCLYLRCDRLCRFTMLLLSSPEPPDIRPLTSASPSLPLPISSSLIAHLIAHTCPLLHPRQCPRRTFSFALVSPHGHLSRRLSPSQCRWVGMKERERVGGRGCHSRRAGGFNSAAGRAGEFNTAAGRAGACEEEAYQIASDASTTVGPCRVSQQHQPARGEAGV